MAIEIEGLDTGLRFNDVKGIFEEQVAFPVASSSAKRAEKALDLLHRNLPRPSAHLRNRTIVQSVITLTCHLLRNDVPEKKFLDIAAFTEVFGKELARQVELGQEATDVDYIEFQRTVNANLRSGAGTRNAILLRKLFSKSPDVYSSICNNASVIHGIESDIANKSSQINELIYQINERYAAGEGKGKDLFKLTNKTTKALNELGKVARDLEGYRRLVEQLYFLFRESIGQRLENQLPQSFRHINDLRTLNEHDVDHGKPQKVAKKRRDLADTFRQYSGAPTPDSVDPAAFLLAHANILGAIENDLRILAKRYVAS